MLFQDIPGFFFFFLKNKSEAHESFVHFKTQVKFQLDTKLKVFQSDWGGEFRSLTPFFNSSSIIHILSCPHVHF